MKKHLLAILIWFFIIYFAYPQTSSSPIVSRAEESVRSVDWSRDGKYFVTGWATNAILWSAQNNTIHSVCTGHKDELVSVKFSDDSRWLLSVSADNSVIVRNLYNESSRATLYGSGITKISDAAFASNGYDILAPIDGFGVYSCFRLLTTKNFSTQVIRRSLELIKGINVNNEHTAYVSISADGLVEVIDIKSRKKIASFPRYASSDITPSFSRDDKCILAAADKNSLAVTDLTIGKSSIIRDMDGFVSCAVFNSDGTRIAASLRNGQVKIYDVQTGSVERIYRLAKGDRALSLAFSPDTEFLLAGTEKGYVLRWSINGMGVEQKDDIVVPEVPVLTEVVQKSVVYEDVNGESMATGGGGNEDDFVPPFNTYSFAGGYMHLPSSYYLGSFTAEINYRNFKLYPFFLGIDALAGTAVPSGDFPYRYRAEGRSISGPYLYTFMPSLTAGISHYFNSKDLVVFCEITGGANFRILCNNSLDYIAYSPVYISGCTLFNCGMQWKSLRLSGGGEWDSNFGFMFKASAGLCVKIKKEDML